MRRAEKECIEFLSAFEWIWDGPLGRSYQKTSNRASIHEKQIYSAPCLAGLEACITEQEEVEKWRHRELSISLRRNAQHRYCSHLASEILCLNTSLCRSPLVVNVLWQQIKELVQGRSVLKDYCLKTSELNLLAFRIENNRHRFQYIRTANWSVEPFH